jgi:acyl carrier protein
MSASYKLLHTGRKLSELADSESREPTEKHLENTIGDIREMIFDTLRSSLQKLVELSDQTSIVDDLGLDSVAVMDFVMEIEDRLDISVPLDKIAEIETLGDLVSTVRDLKGGA